MLHDYKILSSTHNDEVKTLLRLIESARERRKQSAMVVEGIHLLETCLEKRVVCRSAYLNAAALDHPQVASLAVRLRAAGVALAVLSEPLLQKASSLASAPEVLAICDRPLPAGPVENLPCLMLEDIQDPGNMGTLLRGAAASGVRTVFASKGCVDLFSPKVLRAGMGAHFSLTLFEGEDLAARLAAWNGPRLVTHLAGATSLYNTDLTGAVAFVFGNEGAGVSARLLELADHRVKIPMPGDAESLNVAMAATVCLFERVRQLEQHQ
ncbi:TrmH family RNA methyltransferase [Paludibacterium paludis]|uniref:RNA methyltransferase n=1 Tax=Paludibacterium paludis TaxID=1225769 RepID=A0A918P1V3_9NEIS|nr:RNA methyltransferase [Paludibacterium paludis]GGY13059.1 RNA methyltransferase [Paludibacterium paludis]